LYTHHNLDCWEVGASRDAESREQIAFGLVAFIYLLYRNTCMDQRRRAQML